LQLQLALQQAAARARDYLVLVDTSTSKASGGHNQAIKIAEALAAYLGVAGRLALWTINTKTHHFTAGFKLASKFSEGFKALAKEYASGAANIKQALANDIKSFPNGDGRQSCSFLATVRASPAPSMPLIAPHSAPTWCKIRSPSSLSRWY